MSTLLGAAEGHARQKTDTPPELSQPVQKRVPKIRTSFPREFALRFLLGAGAVIVVGFAYSGISFLVRKPCPRCGSRQQRPLSASGRGDARRCLRCGFAVEDERG